MISEGQLFLNKDSKRDIAKKIKSIEYLMGVDILRRDLDDGRRMWRSSTWK